MISVDFSKLSSLSVEECSVINKQLLRSLCSHLESLAPTKLFLHASCPSHLLQRLKNSKTLQDLLSLVDFESTAESAKWMCTAVSVDDNVTVFLFPWQLYCHSVSAVPNTVSKAVLPILMLQWNQAQILSPDLTDTQPPGDVYLHFDLHSPPNPLGPEVVPSLRGLLTQLSSMHSSCYLEQVHSALTEHLPLSEEDFLTGLEACQSSSLSVDVTPLLAGLCQHSLTRFPSRVELGTCSIPLHSDVLCQLLSAALGKLTGICTVQCATAEEQEWTSQCSLHTQLVNQAFRSHLDKLGFKPVTQCGIAYFWLESDSSSKGSEKVRTVSMYVDIVLMFLITVGNRGAPPIICHAYTHGVISVVHRFGSS